MHFLIGLIQDIGKKKFSKYIVAVLLGIMSFSIHYHIALKLDQRKNFDQINIFFDADTSFFLNSFSNGRGGEQSWGGRGFIHLNISNFVNPPIRILAKLAGTFHPQPEKEKKNRRNLALMVSPMAAGLKTSFIFLMLLAIGYPIYIALTIVAIDVASFSGLLFGSIPESYSLTGMAFAILFYVSAISISRKRQICKSVWIIVGVLLFSFTITNIIPFILILILIHSWDKRELSTAVFKSLKLALAAILISLMLWLSITAVYRSLSDIKPRLPGQFEEVRMQITRSIIEFPLALSNTIIPAKPQLTVIPAHPKIDQQNVMFTYRINPRLKVGTILVLAFIFLPSLMSFPLSQPKLRLSVLALITIGFNFILHSFYGNEFFLYSQHWYVALIILIAMWLEPPGKLRIVGHCSLGIFFALTLIKSISVMNFLVASL